MNITCIMCPVGCRMDVEVEGSVVKKVEGNSCPRGEKYAKQEAVAPARIVTAVIKLKNSDIPLSVKTVDTIPKSKIFEAMAELNRQEIYAPVNIGDVVLKNICGTDVDVVATKSVLK